MPTVPPAAPFTSTWARTAEPLLRLVGAGHEVHRDPSYFYDCRNRTDSPQITLQLTLAGAGFYESRRRTRTLLRPGMAFFDGVPGPFRYGYASEHRGVYELVYVSMEGSVAQRWRGRLVRAFGNVLNFGERNPVAPLMLALAYQVRSRTRPDRYLLSAQLYQLVMAVFSHLSEARTLTSTRTSAALALIAARATEPQFNIAHLAGALDCSREHLARVFRDSTGLCPSDYLLQHRLRLVARALRDTGDKLHLIAGRCGFASANYLCRAFRSHYGITPTRFRANPWMTLEN